MKRITIYFLALVLFTVTRLQAQDSTTAALQGKIGEVRDALDGMNETVLTMKSTLEGLSKIKLTGYMQSQYQIAERAGISSFAGGNFPVNVDSRFQVRRGRLKVTYDNDLTQYVLQIDVTQNGVGIKDAYAYIREPWHRTAGLKMGVQDRPFGFEISYSSSSRESPERSRMFQTLFPGERELGASLELLPEAGPWSFFNLKAGVFNGVLNTANENDRNKDFIGRLGFQAPFNQQNLAIDGGVSLYAGNVTSNSRSIYTIDKSASVARYMVDTTVTNVGDSFKRAYYGGDVELYYDIPNLGGLSLRGEYIAGTQPGTSTSNSFYNPSGVTPIYSRKFNGWYATYIQNIGVKNQFLLKYDVLDPNKDVKGSDIGIKGGNLTIADLKYSTLGIGWIYHWDANVKFVFYYDIVKNESVNAAATGTLAPFMQNVKDNVLTVRMQYRF